MAQEATEQDRSTMLMTFLIADIRGYTRFTRERGDAAAAMLAKKFADLARDAVEARGGRVVELRGDEAFAVFESAAQAVRAAVEFQASCAEESQADPAFPLPVGVGIDSGEAVPVEDGYRGAALNMAARLCSAAGAGEVLVTRAVVDATGATDGEVRFVERGPASFKGFEQAVDVIEAVAGNRAAPTVPDEAAEAEARLEESIPPELDPLTPLVDRGHEMRWLRGTWRQVRRGRGRVLFVSGPAQIGKTRLAAELAAHVHLQGGLIRRAGPGGAATALALAAIRETLRTSSPTLLVLDDVDVAGPTVAQAMLSSLELLSERPVLVLALLRDPAAAPDLSAAVERADERGDGHRSLSPLDLEGVRAIVRLYVGDDATEVPVESMARASQGVPGRVHEVVSDWARSEASRRLAAAGEFLAAGRERHSSDLEFANNVIGLKLRRLYSVEGRDVLSLDLGEACPYKGLAPFEEADSAYFFGRERLVGELAARTVQAGLLGVVGASGSGKSSVVGAGLLPSLRAGLLPGSDQWRQVALRPGEHPVQELRSALSALAPEAFGADHPLETVVAGTPPEARLILVVDQFEETFTTCATEDERAEFIAALTGAAKRWPERVAVILSIRGDYYAHCAPYPDLAELLANNHVLVGPLTREELRRAIELPARRVGLRVESSLGDALVEEVGEEPGGLPLLSTALVELWQARDGGWLRLAAYERTGGVWGAVARLAESSYEQLTEPEREAAKIVLLRLVGEGEGESAVRRRVPVSEFDIDRDPAVFAVVSRLTEDRLLTRDDGMIEIAHEALIREWPRLRGWLEEDATGRQLRTHLTQSAKQWGKRDHDAGDLYRGARLSATLDWAQGRDRELNELEREFLAQSRQASDREAERQRRTNRRLRGLLVGTTVFLVVALLAGSLALIQRGHARNAQTAAEAQALRSDAERLGTLALTEPNLDRSFLLAVAGVELQDLPETRGDLLTVLEKTPGLFRLIRPSRSEISALAVSPDGRLLATGDSAGAVHFHDLRTWEPSGAAVRLGGAISQQALVFSPDGGTLAAATATGGNKASLYLVDVSSRTRRRIGSWPSVPAIAGPLRFTRMAFSPDGTRIVVAVATASPESFVPVAQRLFLLEAASGRIVWERKYPLVPGQDETWVAFTPQGVLVTSAQRGETILWDTRTGRIERRFPIGGPFAVSPDGQRAALAQNKGDPFDPSASLSVLDLRTGTHRSLQVLPVPGWIVSVQFTPDGANIVGRSHIDAAVRVWDVASGSIVQTFTGQGSGLNVAVAPGGPTALSGAQDGSVAAWDLSGTQGLGRTFRWREPVEGCATTPCFVIDLQGTLMAEDLSDGTVALVDLRTRRLVDTLPARNGSEADALAFFPDGRTLATGGITGNVTVWDVRTRSVVRMLRFPDRVWWVAVSPDGKLLAVQSKAENSPNSRVEVQDIASGEVLYRHEIRYGTGGLEFSPDGRELAALGCCEPDSTIEVWAARSGAELFSPRVDGHATSIAFSPDGRLFAAGTEDGKVVLWDAHDGSPVESPIQVAAGAIDPISFSPDGRLFAASSADQTATLWDLRARKRLGNPFPTEQGSIPVARFAPDGDLVIDNLTDTALWPTDLRTWERFACQIAGRDLTRAEWSDLLPERPYRHVCPQ